MNKKVIRVLGKNWLDRLNSEELEQEILIVHWKNPGIDPYTALIKAAINILYQEYSFYKKSFNNEELSEDIEYRESEDIEPSFSFILDPSNEHLKKLTPFERYVIYLLTSNNRTEVSSLLNCSPSYLSKVLDSIKQKYLKG